jgi:competence protein ComEA
MSRIQEWWLTLSRQQRWLGVTIGISAVVLGGWLALRQPAQAAESTMIPSATGSGQMQQSSAISSGHRPATQSMAGQSSQASSHDTRVFVDVQGAVAHPGLYQFGADMRVADALKAAGGLTNRADRQQINLATRLTDQQQLYVPIKGEKPPASSAATVTSGSGSQKPGSQATATSGGSDKPTAVVNLNTATVADLQQLTGIGEKKAQKIIDYREAHGSFQTVADLAQVPGFGAKTVANLQDQLTTS